MSKQGAEWYKRYPQRWLGGVRGLSSRQLAVYDLVIELIYQDGGDTENAPKFFAGFFSDLGTAAVRRAIHELIEMGKLVESDGRLSNRLAKNEAKTREKLSKNRGKTEEKQEVFSPKSSKKTNENNKSADNSGPYTRSRDKNREDKKEKELPTGSSKKKTSRGTRISKDWCTSQAEFQYAIDHGLSEQAIRLEEEKFRNYWTAKTGSGATKLDWAATWRNWVLNAQSRMPRGSPANGNPDPNDHSLAAATQRFLNRTDHAPERENRDFSNVAVLPPITQNQL